MEQFIHTLSGLRMTGVSALFLGLSLGMLLGWFFLPVDPAWVTIAISGTPLVYAAATSLIQERSITSSLLITMAMAASIAIGEVFAAGEVAFIMAIGEILEDKTVERAKRGIHNLISLAPQQGRRMTGGVEEIVPVEAIRKGDLLRVLPGETIPVDGDIVSGTTSIDQSVMTGESLPVDKTVGDAVFSGTINRFGAVDVRAGKVGEDSSLQKLIRMVREAETNKAPTQRIVDRWAGWIVPAALAIAVLTYLFTGEIIRAVTVLVVFCPCALALATPTTIMAAIGQATRHGVIIKSGEALEIMGKADSVAFDKTGTLTHGTLRVSDVDAALSGRAPDELLRYAASVEALSEHPMGKAVVADARQRGLELHPATGFMMTPGKGVKAVVEGDTVLCGNPSWLEEQGVQVNEAVRESMAALHGQGKATILVAIGGEVAGLVALSDTLRQSARDMVAELEQLGTDVVLLTGDHESSARYFAQQAGIRTVYAELLPQDKMARIKAMQAEGRTVSMIGDGVNDAPALKTADVGVSMGGMGSDIALDAADIVLMADDISRVPYLKRLAGEAIRTITFNISLAMLINFVAVALSIMGVLTPVTGALVHNAGSVLVVMNAALLYDRKLT